MLAWSRIAPKNAKIFITVLICTLSAFVAVGGQMFPWRERFSNAPLQNYSVVPLESPHNRAKRGEPVKTFNSRRQIHVDEPHTLAISHYELSGGAESTLMLSNQGARALRISPTLFSLDGRRFDVPGFVLSPDYGLAYFRQAGECGPVTENWRFCTSMPIVSVNSGEKIYLEVSLQNLSTEKQRVLRLTGGMAFESIYAVSIADANGKTILSHREALEAKKRAGTLTPEEEANFDWLPVGSSRGPLEYEFEPGQIITAQVDLSSVYDLSKPGKYEIQLSRKISWLSDDPNFVRREPLQIPLGTIEVNVK